MSALLTQIDAAILGLNRLTGCGEDFIWRPADKARDALIAARAALHAAAVAEKVGPGRYRYLDFDISDEGYDCWSWSHVEYDGPEDRRSGTAYSSECKRYGGGLGACVRDIDEFLEDERATAEAAGASA